MRHWMRFGLPLLVLASFALPSRAETYKWVDEKGVTNYSSTPPTAKAKATTVPEDRVSVIQTDTGWKEAAAMSAARPDYATEEWLQRQRLMALKDSYTATAYPDSYYPAYGYGYGYYGGYPVARPRPVHPIVRASLVTPRATPRGAMMR